MFNFIRGMFDKSAVTSGMTWNVPVFNYEYEEAGVDSPYLSQAELQMLQRMMAQYIRTHEQVRKEFKEEALSYPVGDEMRNMLFREHREIKAKLKSLSALQYRLKHKIAARG